MNDLNDTSFLKRNFIVFACIMFIVLCIIAGDLMEKKKERLRHFQNYLQHSEKINDAAGNK